ncbi:MAG: hypothetical protein KDK70_35150 [Myxococcales bacterium]|nr:hypothetical protein [Myxococcales bacterium]
MRRTGWIGIGLGLGVTLTLGLGCSSSSVFQCETDTECGAEGTCQPDVGYCSFPDDACPSGQRFGEHAGDGLSGACVGMGGTGSSSTSAGETTGSGTDDGVDGTGSGGACAGAAECVPLPPPGWEGPVLAMVGSGAAPPCPAQAPQELFVAQAGLQAEPAECACTCGREASACDVTLYASLNGECSEDFGFPLSTDRCVVLDTSLAPVGASVVLPATSGACAADVLEDVSPPAWADEARVCLGATASCGEGACVPEVAAGEGVCIVREGEHTCPLSDYTQAFTFYRGVDDTRRCSACECGGSVGCRVEVHTDDTCAGVPFYQTSLSRDVCEALSTVVPEQTDSVGVLVEATGACEAQGIEPIGDVIALDPITLCCRP